MAGRASWTFTDHVAAERAAQLLAVTGFNTIVQQFAEAQVVAFGWQSFRDTRLHGCRRAFFRLKVSQWLYDQYFNAPCGYRGQYAVGEADGERANRELITRLESVLVGFARLKREASESSVLVSLRGNQAKIWIDESEVESQLGGTVAHIDYEPWRSATETGVGLLAPVGSTLEVKGAWLDAAGVIQSDPHKHGRSAEIHGVGFS
jgi:hypothetical protein